MEEDSGYLSYITRLYSPLQEQMVAALAFVLREGHTVANTSLKLILPQASVC